MSQRKTCVYTGKRIFPNESIAEREATRITKHRVNVTMRAYYCKCKSWHLTNIFRVSSLRKE